MPYLSVATTSVMRLADKQMLSHEAGKLISLIEGKTQSHLMFMATDTPFMTFGGFEKPTAFIDLRLFTAAPFEQKKAFAEAFITVVSEILIIDKKDIFMNITEHNEWGSGGTFFRKTDD